MILNFSNCPPPGNISEINLSQIPEFVSYKPDFELLKNISDQYQNFENILIIAHGGSVTSFYGFYYALKYQAKKRAYFLSTVDPDYILELKQKLSKENTLVIAISKSGETVTQLEMMSQFIDYQMLIITSPDSVLQKIAEKLKIKTVIHPKIGGRYTGLTEVGLLPGAIVGLEITKLYEGAQFFYQNFQKDNLAWQAASVLHQLEKKGIVDVFMPFYSHNLFPTSNLIVQLCHESFGKQGRGQTYFAHEAPESQHHTNQRFFGGQKNICGFFVTVKNFNSDVINKYPEKILQEELKGKNISNINNLSLTKAMSVEAAATMQDAEMQKIPILNLYLENFSSLEVGKFTAFWQLYAVYASLLRDVDPYNQPQVENSKKISFISRLAVKK